MSILLTEAWFQEELSHGQALQGMGWPQPVPGAVVLAQVWRVLILEEVMIHPGSGGDQATRPGVAQVMILDL